MSKKWEAVQVRSGGSFMSEDAPERKVPSGRTYP